MTQQVASPLTAAPAGSLQDITKGRWTIALCGIAIMMMLGTVYAWSAFKTPLMTKHGWSPGEVTFTFTLAIFFLGFSAAFGGRFVDRLGPRKVATIAAVLFGCGTILGGVADSIGAIWLLWVGYGVIGGIGNGLGYVTPVAVLVRWFPDKKGLITGMAVMGFGLGAALMGKLIPLAVAKFGIDQTLYGAGAIFLVGLALAAQKIVNPPVGYALAPKPGKAAVTTTSATGKQALGMYQFYILWGILFLNVTAGIAIISNLSPMAEDLLRATGYASDVPDAVARKALIFSAAGTILFLTALFNGLGRLFWGSLSEKIGRKNVFLLIFLTQVPLFVLLPSISSPWVFTIVACYILLCYGGGFGTMPSFTADTFGPKNIGGIYGMVLFAWGLAGAVGPSLMEWIKASTGDFKMALYIAAGLLAAGFILTCLYRKPAPPAEQAELPTK